MLFVSTLVAAHDGIYLPTTGLLLATSEDFDTAMDRLPSQVGDDTGLPRMRVCLSEIVKCSLNSTS